MAGDHLASATRPKLLSAVPTAAGGIAREAYALACRMRLPIETLVKDSGLTASQLNDPGQRIGVKNQIRLLSAIAKYLPDECLGFHIANRIELREMGLLYYVQASSGSLGEALRRGERYCSMQNEGVRLRDKRRNDLTLELKYNDVRRLSDHHQMECFVTMAVRLCRQLTGRHLLPTRIELAHRRPAVPSEIAQFFGCEVIFGSHTDEIHFPLEVTQLPIAGADMYLNKLLIRYCEEALSRRSLKATAWRLSVENAAAPLLPHGKATSSEISRQLGVTERTLARRLGAEGTTFAKVLDELRFELAKRYLSEVGLSISQIAWLIGYQDPSAFSHAYKRWSGRTPRHARLLDRPDRLEDAARL